MAVKIGGLALEVRGGKKWDALHLILIGGFPQHFSLGTRKRIQLDKETGRGLGPAEWAAWVKIYFPGEKTLPW